jgi:hypothetical protein
MTTTTISSRPKRCKEKGCKRILRKKMNKSGLCSYHMAKRLYNLNQEKIIKKRLMFCAICGAKINGKLQYQVRKNVYYGFCSCCFEKIRVMDKREIYKLVYSKSPLKNK